MDDHILKLYKKKEISRVLIKPHFYLKYFNEEKELLLENFNCKYSELSDDIKEKIRKKANEYALEKLKEL